MDYAVPMGMIGCEEMRALEEKIFRAGISAESLMDKAGRRLGEAVGELYPRGGTAVAYIGRGNNGGDALVALHVLRAAGWQIVVRCPFSPLELGLLPRRKLRDLGEVELKQDALDPAACPGELLLIDGLLGIGASGPLREPLCGLAAEMNYLRRHAGAQVVAVDIPSGLNGDNGEPGEGAVQADLTATIGIPKKGLIEDQALDNVGRIVVIPLEELAGTAKGDRLITGRDLCAHFPPRNFGTHKGQAGRVGIVAGSRGMLGAAGLAALGALRGGAGLVTIYVLEEDYPLLVSTGPPLEAMVRPVSSYREIAGDREDAMVIGPGLGNPGQSERVALLDLIAGTDIPLVVDADGAHSSSWRNAAAFPRRRRSEPGRKSATVCELISRHSRLQGGQDNRDCEGRRSALQCHGQSRDGDGGSGRCPERTAGGLVSRGTASLGRRPRCSLAGRAFSRVGSNRRGGP